MKIIINVNNENFNTKNTLNIIYCKCCNNFYKNNKNNITFNIAGEENFGRGTIPIKYIIEQLDNNIEVIKNLIIEEFIEGNNHKNNINHIKKENNSIVIYIENNDYKNFIDNNIEVIKNLIIEEFIEGKGIIKPLIL